MTGELARPWGNWVVATHLGACAVLFVASATDHWMSFATGWLVTSSAALVALVAG